jgi:hypothetical protein
MIMRSGASVSQLLACSFVPRGARIVRLLSIRLLSLAGLCFCPWAVTFMIVFSRLGSLSGYYCSQFDTTWASLLTAAVARLAISLVL